jgi:hypothetical protein
MCSEVTNENDVENLRFEIAKTGLEDVISINLQTNEEIPLGNFNDGIVQIVIKNNFT